MSTHRSTILQLFRTEEESDRHKKLSEAITDISNAFNTLTHAYLCKLAVDDLTDHLSDRLYKACDFIEQAGTALSNIQSADGSTSSQAPQTYANAAKRKRAILPGKITLDLRKSIPISTALRVVVGPTDAVKNNFASVKDTKETLLKALDPNQLKLRTSRVHYASDNSVVIIADNVDVDALRKNDALTTAGLEVKPDEKLSPRVIIHDVPADYSEDEILLSLIDLNLPRHTREDTKIISLYPVRDKKKHRSCVVEVKPECRKALRNQERIFIKWSSCRFADQNG